MAHRERIEYSVLQHLPGPLLSLLISWGISNIALWTWVIAISTISFQQAGTEGVAIALVARLVPSAIASPFAMMLALRLSVGTGLAVSKIVRMGAILLAVVVIVNDGPLWMIYLTVVIEGVGSGPLHPLHMHAMPYLAARPDELATANSVTEILRAAALIVGPAIAALGFFFAETTQVILAILVLLLVAVLLLAPSRQGSRRPVMEKNDHFVNRFLVGARSTYSDSRTSILVGLSALSGVATGALQLFITGVAVEILDWGRPGPGVLLGIVGIGGLLGGAASLNLVAKKDISSLPAIGLAAIAISAIAFGTLATSAIVVFSCLVGGIGLSVLLVSTNALMLRTVDHAMQPAVFGMNALLQFVGVGAGGIAAASLVSAFQLHRAPLAFGILLLILAIGFLLLLSRRFADISYYERELAVVQSNRALRNLPIGPALQIASALEAVEYQPNRIIVRQGEPGDEAFLIEDGMAEVKSDETVVSQLGPGEIFGEIALLYDVPRTASVRSLTSMVVWRLDRESFLYSMTSSPDCYQSMVDLAGGRLSGKEGNTRRQ
jgi:MFS family permease